MTKLSIDGVAFLIAGVAGLYALYLREKLIAEIQNLRSVSISQFPVHVPLLLERAHRFDFPQSSLRSRFRHAYLTAVSAAVVGAAIHLFTLLGR